jgi:lysine-N-methylase
VDGRCRVLLHDVETGDVIEIGPREWVLLAAADGTRDLDGILMAASRDGVRADRDALAALLEGLREAGMLAEGPLLKKTVRSEGAAAGGASASDGASARGEDGAPIARDARPIERLEGYSFHCDGHGSCCQLYATVVFSPLEAARARSLRPDVLDGGERHEHAFMPERGAGPCAGSAVALVNGRCAYLEGSLCSLHRAGGAASKPLGCNLFPLALVDDGARVRASVSVECACVLASVGKPGGQPILAEERRVRGDLDPAIVVDELPAAVAISEGREASAAEYLRWSDAALAAWPEGADAAQIAWALAGALGERGFDPAAARAAALAPPPVDLDLAARFVRALAAKAARRAKSQNAWRSPRDLCRRGVSIVTAAATLLDDAEVLAAVALGAGAVPADEAFYLRAALFGHQMVGYPIATALRDKAVAIWIARAFPLAADALYPGESEPAFAHPLALVEALLRGHGLRRYTEEVAADPGAGPGA